jgi:2',3'-cyclic-nucleotide 2'-phosphodiesterase/3'-nucleotidase/5'-nucleotidase
MNSFNPFSILVLILSLSFGLHAQIGLQHVSTYHTGIFDASAAEILAHDASNQGIFFVNGANNSIDVLDISTPATPILINSIDLSAYGSAINSVSIHDTIVAAAVEGATIVDSGSVVFLGVSGTFLKQVEVGVMPDMVTFSSDGSIVMTANEGEPDATDPLGSVSIIDMSGGIGALSQSDVTTLNFTSFNNSNLANVRIFPGKNVDEDLEPEYVTIDIANQKAYVSLQENNALAIIDLSNNTVSNIVGLGYKDHNQAGMGLDPSDRDNGINIAPHPVMGMYMPDAIASYTVAGNTYIISANEGDDRGEDERIKDVTLDPTAFPNAAQIQEDSVLGRLGISSIDGDYDNDNDYDTLFSYGTRSFTIWDANGALVYDSGDDLEQRTAAAYPNDFNANNDANSSFESRSDNKGPEPEAVEIAMINSNYYAFIGLERIGGVAIYDVTNPNAPTFVDYVNNRDFSVAATDSAAMDLGVEDIYYISNSNSPDGKYYIATANEVSGTVSLFEITGVPSSTQSTASTIQLKAVVGPNPVLADVQLHIQAISTQKEAMIRIFNMQGQAVYQAQHQLNAGSSISLDHTADLPAGTYTLHLLVEGQGFALSFVKP